MSLAASLAAACLPLLPAAAGQPRTDRDGQAFRVIVDAVLVESTCRAFDVDHAALYAFAERNGIDPVDLMPSGQRRAAFDEAFRRRATEVKGADLCGRVAAECEAAIPGVLKPR